MSQTIKELKFNIQGRQEREIPIGSKIISSNLVNDIITLYILIDMDENEKETLEIAIVKTGSKVEEVSLFEYVHLKSFFHDLYAENPIHIWFKIRTLSHSTK